MLSILSHIVINSRLYHIGYCAVSFVIKRLMRNQIENRTFNHSNSKSKSKTDTTTFGKSALVNHSLIAIRLRVNVVCVCEWETVLNAIENRCEYALKSSALAHTPVSNECN